MVKRVVKMIRFRLTLRVFVFRVRISSQGRGSRGEQIQVKIITKLWDFDAPESDE